MVHKLPIVSSDAGGIPEVLDDGYHALLFPAGDIAKMLAHVNEALSNPDKMRSLAECARKRIEQFSSERMVENYLAVLRQLHNPPRRHLGFDITHRLRRAMRVLGHFAPRQ
jgi:glycosyltransferase involved in cell wall biosynthesis